ncbi:hypothetical protein D3C77_517500 [compost metagenome]
MLHLPQLALQHGPGDQGDERAAGNAERRQRDAETVEDQLPHGHGDHEDDHHGDMGRGVGLPALIRLHVARQAHKDRQQTQRVDDRKQADEKFQV